MNKMQRIPSLEMERFPGGRFGIFLLVIVFMLTYFPWLGPMRELCRQEALYAVMASEFSSRLPVMTAHHVAITNGYPLFPVLSAVVNRVLGVPMESALRGVSVAMLALLALLAGITAGQRRNLRAGLVASAMCFSVLVALEKVIEGTPQTTSAFFLLLAQLLFFHFGCRLAEWNRAWLFSAFPLTLGFLSGGIMIIVYFFFPMIFFRRPLSVSGKFQKPGFFATLGILGCGLLLWGSTYLLAAELQYAVDYFWLQELTSLGYLRALLAFPLMLPVRLLPWTLLAWFPFCVALQALDPTPVFSRYLRTLVFSTLALCWLQPGQPGELLFLVGPLSVLTGLNYDLGVRRYGWKLRKLLSLGCWLSCGVALLMIIGIFFPESWLRTFVSLHSGAGFRESRLFLHAAYCGVAALVLIAWVQQRGNYRRPVWFLVFLPIISCGIFYAVMMLPYRAQEAGKRRFGEAIRQAVVKGGGAPILYKYDIVDLYGGLFYTHIPVAKIKSLEELPDTQREVYLISTRFPQCPGRTWQNLLPENFTYQKHPVQLWKGTLRPLEPEAVLP